MNKSHKLLIQTIIGITFIIELVLIAGASYQDNKAILDVARNHYGLLLITLICYLIVTFLHAKVLTSADYIRLIQEIDWTKANPYEIVESSYQTGQEFADSLRIALKLYTDNKALRLMAEGELDTNNLRYNDYGMRGDHYKFLLYFIRGYSLNDKIAESRKIILRKAFANYHEICKAFTPHESFETIVSREHALPGIFEKILTSHDWESLGLGFYKYYLSEHIRLDSEEGGHGDLLKDIELDEKVLTAFWKARYEMYKELIPEPVWDTTKAINYPPPHC